MVGMTTSWHQNFFLNKLYKIQLVVLSQFNVIQVKMTYKAKLIVLKKIKAAIFFIVYNSTLSHLKIHYINKLKIKLIYM